MLAGAWIGLAALLAIAAVAVVLTGLARREPRRRDGGPILGGIDRDDHDHIHDHDHGGGHDASGH